MPFGGFDDTLLQDYSGPPKQLNAVRRLGESMRALRIMSVLLLFPVVTFAADNPLSGTWKLNLEKSKLAASDHTKSDVFHIKADDNSISLQEEQTDDKGSHRFSVEAKYDGKDYPIKVAPPDPSPSTAAYKRVGTHEVI